MNKDDANDMITFLEARLEDNRRLVLHIEEANGKLKSQINLLWTIIDEIVYEEFLTKGNSNT